MARYQSLPPQQTPKTHPKLNRFPSPSHGIPRIVIKTTGLIGREVIDDLQQVFRGIFGRHGFMPPCLSCRKWGLHGAGMQGHTNRPFVAARKLNRGSVDDLVEGRL